MPRTPEDPLHRSVVTRILLHVGCLVVAIGCFAMYEHWKAEGRPDVALASLAAAAVFGFTPLRDLIHVVFRIEGTALHLVHAVGGLALLVVPLTGGVSGVPVLTHAAMAPFAIMGAAQAIMHQNHPRNAEQAAALRRFAASLPEVAQFDGGRNLSSPANAERAVLVLSDLVAKAQALGETELRADPRFQSALGQATTRVGTGLGLDAVNLALDKLAASPAAGAVPALRRRVAQARQTLAAGTR